MPQTDKKRQNVNTPWLNRINSFFKVLLDVEINYIRKFTLAKGALNAKDFFLRQH